MSDQEYYLEIVQPGRPVGQYRSLISGVLRLEAIFNPEVVLPFDLAILSLSLTVEGEPLQAILVDQISHPPHSQIPSRLIGGLGTKDANTILLAVPSINGHYANVKHWEDLPEADKEEINRQLMKFHDKGETPHLLNIAEIRPLIKDAYFRYRQARKEDGQIISSRPAWKPLEQEIRTTSYLDASHYTDSEYTFYQLPNPVKDYINSYLGDDERVLYAISRPKMSSQRRKAVLGKPKLKQGVLLLTTQQLIHLVEIVPLEDNGLKYGYSTQMGILERLEGVTIEVLNREGVLLKTSWKARQFVEVMEMEFPSKSIPSLEAISKLLAKFLPGQVGSKSIKRATMPIPAEPLPDLIDPAANDHNETALLQERFRASLSRNLTNEEKVLTWALIPVWFDPSRYARVLVVTQQRFLTIPDPLNEKEDIQEVQFSDVSTLKYAGSVINSYIGFHIVKDGQIQEVHYNFPYPAIAAFKRCFDTARRAIAVLPIT